MNPIWIKLWLNPEPWAIGSVSRGKTGARISPNPNLVAFQSAVRGELEGHELLPETHRKITFYFWRQQAQYLDMSDKVRSRNQADSTNMQKGLEDALQGILFKNDREIRDIRSVIVQQGHTVEPCILIKAEEFKLSPVLGEIPEDLLKEVITGPQVTQHDNVWRGPGA